MTRIGGYNKLSNVQRNIAINPMPVEIDKALLPLGLYSVLLLVSSFSRGQFLQKLNLRGDDLPLCRSRCNSLCTQGGLLYPAAFPYLLGGLSNSKAIPV